MTVRQLHYTSCEHGLEGIQGFQVRAATPGAPADLTSLAVRVSTYQPGPGLTRQMTEDDLAAFPVAFGYAPAAEGATLFQSRYAGRDFTGRMGNYFAHCLLLDDPIRDLHDVLPIDFYRSPLWTDHSTGGTELAPLRNVPPGPSRHTAVISEVLGDQAGAPTLVALLAQVIGALATGRGGLVLRVTDDRQAALWLAAISRCLPRALAMRLSFVTYTSRPEEQDLLISCTTPDVRVSGYDRTVIDVSGTAGGQPPRDAPGRFSEVAVAAAAAGRLDELLELVQRAEPAATAGELDTAATVAAAALRLSQPDLTEADLLDAISFAADRLPGGMPAVAWQVVTQRSVQLGGPQDLGRWADVLRAATRPGAPHAEVPAAVLSRYLVAALRAAGGGAPSWLPELSESDLYDVAQDVVLPQLCDRPPADLLRQIGGHRQLRGAVVAVLERRLTGDPGALAELAAGLAPQAAETLAGAVGQAPAVRRLLELIKAREGGVDRVAVFVASHADLAVRGVLGERELAALIWPAAQPPTAGDGVTLVRRAGAELLVNSGLAGRLAELVIAALTGGRSGPDELELAVELARSPVLDRLDERIAEEVVAIAHAARLAALATAGGPARAIEQAYRTAVTQLVEVTGAVATHLLDATARVMVAASDPNAQLYMLDDVLTEGPDELYAAYRRVATAALAADSPERLALIIAVWRCVRRRPPDELLRDVLAAGLKRRRRKDLDRVGEQFEHPHGALRSLIRDSKLGRTADWAHWWQQWRLEHERRGMFGKLGLGRLAGGKR